MGNEERGIEDLEETNGSMEETGAFKRKRRRSVVQSATVTAEEIDGLIRDGNGKSPRKKSSREDSSGLRVDYLAVSDITRSLADDFIQKVDAGGTGPTNLR